MYKQPVTSHVYERATEPGLPAGMICTPHNQRKHQILNFMEIALSNSDQLLIWLGPKQRQPPTQSLPRSEDRVLTPL